jgi:hypothetical protein
MKTVVITRKLWGQKRLRRKEDGKMCCLGFLCRSYGLSNEDITGRGMPGFLYTDSASLLPEWLLKLDASSPDAGTAAFINDNETITMAKKEELLKPLFLKHGIKLVFRGPLS